MVDTSAVQSESSITVPGISHKQTENPGHRSGIPIIFIHKGYSPYLEFTLRQVVHSNPNSPIHFLGDSTNNRFPFVIHHHISEYLNEEADHFTQVYQHTSPNQFDYELFCFVRWYVVKELMKREGFSRVFVADSDVMIYSDITAFVNRSNLDTCLAAYNIGVDHQWVRSASGHSSYWTWEGINLFCEMAINLYSEPRLMAFMDQIRAEKIIKNDSAGVSDMTALYVFYEEHRSRIQSLSECRNGSAFDHNICMATNYNLNEYEFGLGRKKIVMKNGSPVAYNKFLKQEITLHTLHFQGNSKNIIHRYYTGKGLLDNKVYRELRFRASVLYHMVKS
ncbi:hypothetical protein GCM10027299_51370 [Larkinella ripae]